MRTNDRTITCTSSMTKRKPNQHVFIPKTKTFGIGSVITTDSIRLPSFPFQHTLRDPIHTLQTCRSSTSQTIPTCPRPGSPSSFIFLLEQTFWFVLRISLSLSSPLRRWNQGEGEVDKACSFHRRWSLSWLGSESLPVVRFVFFFFGFCLFVFFWEEHPRIGRREEGCVGWEERDGRRISERTMVLVPRGGLRKEGREVKERWNEIDNPILLSASSWIFFFSYGPLPFELRIDSKQRSYRIDGNQRNTIDTHKEKQGGGHRM